MNRNLISILIAIFFVLATIATLGCASTEEEPVQALEDTDVTLEDIDINEISSEQIDLTIILDIYNPNNVTVELERMEYDLFANDVRIGSGSFEEPLEIPPFEEQRATTNFVAPVSAIPSAILNALMEGSEVKWTVEGTMFFATPTGTIEQTFSKEIQKESRG
jgi:LEA14-like dessication related protein